MRKRIKVITIEEMNRLLSIVKNQCPNIYYREKTKDEDFKRNAYIEIKSIDFKLSFCLGLKPCTYICRLDGEIARKYLTSGQQAYALFHRYYKEAKIYNIPPKSVNAKQRLRKNPKFDGKRVKAYGYDMHEAFSFFLMNPWPDTSKDLGMGVIREDEYGFIERANGDMRLIDRDFCKKHGLTPLAQHRFKKMPCPEGVEKFVRHIEKRELYAKKQIKRYEGLIKKSKDKVKREKYKKMRYKHTLEKYKCKALRNYLVGYLSYTNPWIRNMVVGSCNNFFANLWDPETSIYSNTDSIVSTIRIPELEAMIGPGCGQIEFEHFNEDFAWREGKQAYQWNLDYPKYNGKSSIFFKKWAKEHGRPWDILIDELPECKTPYKFDINKLKIVRDKEW